MFFPFFDFFAVNVFIVTFLLFLVSHESFLLPSISVLFPTCIFSVFENKDKIILVMEHADGGELYDYINNNRLTERDARRVFRQITSAIKYCHQVNTF